MDYQPCSFCQKNVGQELKVTHWFDSEPRRSVNVLLLLISDPVLRSTRSRALFCFNRPFPSCLSPEFQNESSGEPIQMKMTLICMKTDVKLEHIFI